MLVATERTGEETLASPAPRLNISSNSLRPLNSSFPSGFTILRLRQTSNPHPLPSRSSLWPFAPNRDAAAMSPSSPPCSLNDEDEKSWSRINRPRRSVLPVPSSDKIHERNPLPVHESSRGGWGDAAVFAVEGKARVARARRDGSRV